MRSPASFHRGTGHRGMTLVEVLIVIALFGILSMAGMAFTSGWVNSNRVLDGENLMRQAFSRAKATALRNQFGITGTEPAAVICIANDLLTVRGAPSTANAASCSSTNILWRTELSPLLDIQAGGANLSCACLSNKGRLTSSSCATCATTSTITLSSGDEDVSVTLL